jgi:hypothetical protein
MSFIVVWWKVWLDRKIPDSFNPIDITLSGAIPQAIPIGDPQLNCGDLHQFCVPGRPYSEVDRLKCGK